MAKTPDDSTVTTTASRPWVWMPKKGEGLDKGDGLPDRDKKRADKFASGTNFKARSATKTARQTPGKDDSVGFTQDSVVKVCRKIFHGDVQEAVMDVRPLPGYPSQEQQVGMLPKWKQGPGSPQGYGLFTGLH